MTVGGAREAPVVITPLTLPLVGPGDDLGDLLASALEAAGIVPIPHDAFVVTQKIVSKAEGRAVDLGTVVPGPEALRLAALVGSDPRLVEVILGEARTIVRAGRGVLIVETHHGWVCANGGVDRSNVEGDCVLRLPVDPDASARGLRAALEGHFAGPLAVVVSDSHGRPWRRGTVGVAIGASGLEALEDLRGTPDLYGASLTSTEVARADALAAAATMVLGEAAEGTPAAHIRGSAWRQSPTAAAQDLQRPLERDLFR